MPEKSCGYLDLGLTFAKIGLFTFGGGYAMIPIIENLCVEQKRWLTAEEMAQTIIIAESTPGPIAINCATFVGFKQRGWLGALVTSIGICLPSFLIICAIALCFQDFLQYRIVADAFAGINIAVGLLVLQAGAKMAIKMEARFFSWLIVVLAFTALGLGEYKIAPINSSWTMLGAVILSLAYYVISGAASAEAAQLADNTADNNPANQNAPSLQATGNPTAQNSSPAQDNPLAQTASIIPQGERRP
ncbi:chromate transporter [bacterium]|nr:chromate transporter [bacterium]